MLIKVRELVPAEQIIVIHAHLPGVEWDGVIPHIYATAGALPVHVTRAGKTFLDMVEHRGMFPSPKYRQCTSDLKRGPIEREIRALVKARGNGLVVNCMGLRAEESTARSRRSVLTLNKRNSKAGREWYDWLPIHDLTTSQVFQTIADAGQPPHWAYGAGMTRLSCCFCIMSSIADLCTAARLRPELLDQYVQLEKRLGHTLMMPPKGRVPRRLDQIIQEARHASRHSSAMTIANDRMFSHLEHRQGDPRQVRRTGRKQQGNRWRKRNNPER